MTRHRWRDISLDIRHHFRYKARISLRKGRRPGDAGRRSECGARGRGLVTSAPGRLGHHPAGTMTGARGASLQPGPAPAGELRRLSAPSPGKPGPTLSLGDESPSGESRGGTPRGEPPSVPACVPGRFGGGKPRPKRARVATFVRAARRNYKCASRRSASFLILSFLAFLFFLGLPSLIEPKAGPTAA